MSDKQDNDETTENECPQCKGEIEHDHEEMCDACREHHELHTWNHMGVVNILADEADHHCVDGEDKVILYGDDLQVTLDVGSSGYDHEHEWVNHAGVQITEDRVILHVSVADPRGAITLEIERKANGDRIMVVPHENDPMQHVRLTPLFRTPQGNFLLGESAEADELDKTRFAYQRECAAARVLYRETKGRQWVPHIKLRRRLMLAESALGEVRVCHETGQGNLGEIIAHYRDKEGVEMPNAFDGEGEEE